MDQAPLLPAPFRRFVAVALALAALAACSTPDGDLAGSRHDASTDPAATSSAFPTEEASTPTIPVPPDFEAPDTRSVRLLPVVGRERPRPANDGNTLPVDGGRAILRVQVVEPGGGVVPGASVRFERFVGDQRGWVTVRAGRDGVATFDDALGGRYRVRAWLAPDLASTESQLTFVGESETKELQVQVRLHDAPILQGALMVPQWSVGEVASFEVLLVQEEVDGEGIIRGQPVSSLVTLAPIAGPRVDGPNPLLTDPVSGRTSFPLVCLVPGTHQVVLSGYGRSITVILPECLPSSNPIPPAPGEDDAIVPVSPTTGSPTTSTTVPAPIAFPVGSSFTVPFDPLLPAGTYVSTDVAANDCRTGYEQYRAGRWTAQRANGATLTLTQPGRRFRAVEGSTACTFERTR